MVKNPFDGSCFLSLQEQTIPPLKSDIIHISIRQLYCTTACTIYLIERYPKFIYRYILRLLLHICSTTRSTGIITLSHAPTKVIHHLV